jgi:lipoyl(octanoyl) transferase
MVEHPPVFTQGQAGKAEHILNPGDIPIIQVDRGGQVTYHGPGQIVIYPLIDLKRHKIGIKALVNGIEEALIQTMAEYDVQAQRKEKAPGVYVEGKKIASLGLRVRKGCTFHGLAFNIRMDLEPFLRINPCGYAGLEVTQLSELNNLVEFDKVQEQLIKHLCQILNFNINT